MPPWRFWDLTYRELFAIFKARNIDQTRTHKLAIFEAWHAAAFYRSKRLPELGPLLRKIEPSRVMSPKEMRATIIGTARAMGAKVVIHKKGEAF